MFDWPTLSDVLSRYPGDCQPSRSEPLDGAGGFSGSALARLTTPRGLLCLRVWPREYPPERLEFVQAVLWVAQRQGFDLAPVPIETADGKGYLVHQGRLWELSPWMPGVASYHQAPSPEKLASALTTLAWFHRATAEFPVPEPSVTASPGIAGRLSWLSHLKAGQLRRIAAAVDQMDPKNAVGGRAGDVQRLARDILAGFTFAAPQVERLLRGVAMISVRQQPCIRDIWHDHVLFVDDRVTGIVDFGAMRVDSAATDLARLIGSLALDDADAWRLAIAAYRQVRTLSEDELSLVRAFDQSAVLLGGLQWLEWLAVEGRIFPDAGKVIERLEENALRLRHLAGPISEA